MPHLVRLTAPVESNRWGVSRFESVDSIPIF